MLQDGAKGGVQAGCSKAHGLHSGLKGKTSAHCCQSDQVASLLRRPAFWPVCLCLGKPGRNSSVFSEPESTFYIRNTGSPRASEGPAVRGHNFRIGLDNRGC